MESGVAWEQVEHLGWSKVRYIAPVLTEENAAQWIEIAEGRTAVALQHYVREQKKAAQAKLVATTSQETPASTQVDTVTADASEDATPSSVQGPLIPPAVAAKSPVMRVFKLYAGQDELVNAALENAKSEPGTAYDNVALQNVCLAYLSSPGVSTPEAILRAAMKTLGWAPSSSSSSCGRNFIWSSSWMRPPSLRAPSYRRRYEKPLDLQLHRSVRGDGDGPGVRARHPVGLYASAEHGEALGRSERQPMRRAK